MATLWTYESDGNHYEVRRAGASIRLYRNGVNHSQWNPKRPLAGSVWDLLTLPALHRSLGGLDDALLLGFGAGTSARQLREIAAVRRVVGVELDPVHLSVADGFFDCSEGCELVAGDAVEWVEDGVSASYDFIVDDLYAEEGGEPVRCAPMDAKWFDTLGRLLRPEGILVLNLIEPEKVDRLAIFRDAALRRRFPYAIGYCLSGYENRVLAFSSVPFSPDQMSRNLKSICRRFPRCYGVGQRYKPIRLL